MGDVAVHFTKNNPTGHYVLDLSMKPQHDVCLRLVELQKHQVHLFWTDGANFKSCGYRMGAENSTSAPPLMKKHTFLRVILTRALAQ